MARIGYARISTGDQKAHMQIDALQHAGCERIFEEVASGSKKDRPGLIGALDYLREGDTLVVWRLDRLARSLKQLIETVESLENAGVGLLSLTENLDTGTPGGKLVFHVFGALAEFERSLIQERTLVGLESARRRGSKGGRPVKFTEEKQRQAKKLLKNTDMDVKDVAKVVGVSVATIYNHLPGAKMVALDDLQDID